MSAKARELLLAARLRKANNAQNQNGQPVLLVTKTEISEPVKIEPVVINTNSELNSTNEELKTVTNEVPTINIMDSKINLESESIKKIEENNNNKNEIKSANKIEKDKIITVNKKKNSILENNPKFAIFNQKSNIMVGSNMSFKPKQPSKEIKIINNLTNNPQINKKVANLEDDVKDSINKEISITRVADNVDPCKEDLNAAKDKKILDKEKKLTKLNTAKQLINNSKTNKEQDLKTRPSMKIMDLAGNLGKVMGNRTSIMTGMPGSNLITKNEVEKIEHQIEEEECNDKENDLVFKPDLSQENYTKGDLTSILISKPVKEVRKKARNNFNI